MQKRRFEKVAVMLLSIIMLLTSTGIVSSLAVNVSESSAAPVSPSTEVLTSASVTEEGGSITSSTVAQEGGSVVADNGDGTQENPYKISTAEQFLAIGNKVNNTASKNKHFVLVNDIDLSAVTAKDFENGSLIGIDKTLSATSENVFIVLDGNSYNLKGLNVEFTKGTEASIFGALNAKSVIKNIKIDRPVFKSTSSEMANLALVAAENKGTVSGIEIAYPVLTAESTANSAFVVAVNYGTISDVAVKGTHTNISSATADSHTISSVGTVGAVAGLNHGTVSNVSAINVGMFIPEAEVNTVYGGIAGANSGAVLNSVSTGNVMGGKAADVVGGIVGKAVAPVGGKDATSTLTNNYTLVAISDSVWGCGVIGAAGKAEMMTDCFWSGAVSGKDVMSTDFGAGINELSAQFKLIPEGKSVTLDAKTVKDSVWGKASVELDGEITVKGEGVKAQTKDGSVEVTAETAGKAAYATYYAKLMLPANVGAAKASNTLKQYQKIYLVTVNKDAEGNGTAAKPFVIKSASDFAIYKYVPTMNAVLGNDIKLSTTVPAIKGTFDGNGYTISAAKPLASNVYGTVKDVNVEVTANISSAVFGNAINASLSGVAVTMADGVVLDVQVNNRGILFNRIGGQSVIDDCHAQGDILINADKLSAIGGFAGLINGKATVTNSGAVANITLGEGFTAQKTANFVGSVTAEDVAVSNCYVGGKNLAGEFSFIADMPEKIKLENIVTGWSFDGGNVGFFTGNGGAFTTTLPAIKAFADSTAEDYEIICDGEKLVASVAVDGGKLTLNVQRAEGVVTLKDVPVTVANKKTGLSATINISNGLEKDAEGRYIITSAYDLAYVSENIAELSASSFIMQSDVDMSVLDSFAPIGTTDVAFSGTFDGNGKTVKNLTIDGTAKVGLFGVLNGATVKNIKFVNATVSSTGGYAAVLAGQVTGKALISGVTVEGAKVTSADLYTGVLIGAVDSTDAPSVADITLKNNSVNSDSNYAGALAGRVNGNATFGNIVVDGFTANGASYVAGAVGLAQGEATLSAITVSGATLCGVSEISGIASGNGKTTIKASSVKNSEISTLALTSANTAGGVSAVFGSAIENVSVENTNITAGIAGGIVGKTIADCDLTVKNASVSACKINSSDANTVVAGILGVHNVKGTVTVEGAVVDEQTVIGGGAVSAGLVGDCSGAQSTLKVSESKTFATVNGAVTANAVAAAGALGRIGVSAVNNIKLDGIKVGGAVSGGAAVGGITGIIKDGDEFTQHTPLVSDCVVFAQVNASDAASAGMIIGAVEGGVLNSENMIFAVRDVLLTTYYGVNAYPTDALSGGYIDMDSKIIPTVNTLSTDAETNVTLYGLPVVDGYKFDSATGWASESEDRIKVLSSTENEVVLKAERRANVKIVAYYVLESDADIRIPVHFNMISTVPEPLKGSGTSADPYLVSNAYELEAVAQYADKGAYFALAEDIVLTQADFEFGGAFYNVGNGNVTIGNAETAFNGSFTGLYNGKIHSITGLKVSGNTFGGLFGATDGAVITDLVINSADVSATTNAGILAGRAKNTTIKNVVINSSKVEVTGFGGAVGGVVGVAEETTIDGVTLNGVTVKTSLEATSATVEVAGGVAGIFDGVVKNANLSKISVTSDAIGAGIVGVANSGTYISKTDADAQVKAEIAGGIAGEMADPMYFSIDGVTVSGKVDGSAVAAGVVAKVTATAENRAFDKLNSSLVRDTVISAVISGDVKAVVIGEVSDTLAVDKENANANVFENVYYSSYQNELGAFGAEQFNAYQNSEYEIIDLSALWYSANGEISDSIKLGTVFTVLADDSIVLNGAEGTYKSFTIGEKVYELKTITSDVNGLVIYDAEANAVKLAELPNKAAKLVFVYNGGLEIAIDIYVENSVDADANAVNVNCSIVNLSGDASLSDKLIAVLLKTKDGESANAFDFFATADSQPDGIGAVKLADGKMYVNMLLPEGYTFTVNAVDENSASLATADAGSEGILVKAGSSKTVSLTITVEETEVEWGLRALWSVIGK